MPMNDNAIRMLILEGLYEHYREAPTEYIDYYKVLITEDILAEYDLDYDSLKHHFNYLEGKGYIEEIDFYSAMYRITSEGIDHYEDETLSPLKKFWLKIKNLDRWAKIFFAIILLLIAATFDNLDKIHGLFRALYENILGL